MISPAEEHWYAAGLDAGAGITVVWGRVAGELTADAIRTALERAYPACTGKVEIRVDEAETSHDDCRDVFERMRERAGERLDGAGLEIFAARGEDGDGYEVILAARSVALDLESTILLLGVLGGARLDASVEPEVHAAWWADTIGRRAEDGCTHWDRFDGVEFQHGAVPLQRDAATDAAFSPAVVAVAVEDGVWRSLDGLASRAKASRAHVVLVVWQALLARMAPEPTPIGLSLDGRSDDEVRHTLGLLTRAVPIEPIADLAAPVAALASNAARVRAEAAEWQDYFRLSVASADSFPAIFESADLPDFVRAAHSCTVRFRLKLALSSGGANALEIHFDRNAIAPADAERFGAYVSTALAAAAREPSASASSLDYLPAGEARELVAFSGCERTHRPEGTVVEAFERQVDASPDEIALVYGDRSLTYGELYRDASRLATALERRHAIRRGEPVILALDHSDRLLVAIWGVLLAGGAYVPVPVGYPSERRAFVARDCGSRVAIVDSPESHAELSALVPVVVSLPLDETAEAADERIAVRPSPSDACYVIYTSGSTGTPKGVVVPHAAVVSLVAALHERVFSRHPERLRFSLLASFGFDASVQQIFGALLGGHTLVVTDPAVKRDPVELAEVLARSGVDVMDCTPSLLTMLVDHPTARLDRLAVRHVLVGGEALTSESMRRLGARWGLHPPLVTNVYGLTECGVDSTAYSLDPRDYASDLASAPVGTPLSNSEISVLDVAGRPSPVGCTGEIYVGGPCLASGYVGSGGLSHERFVPHPTRDGFMFRTGDRGRWLADGNLLFEGRSDDQIKIRGHRIDLRDVEAAVAAHPTVSAAAVLAAPNDFGDRDLVAFVVPRDGFSPARAREALGRQLTEVMLPAEWIEVSAIPLTSSGKVDKEKLLELRSSRAPEAADAIPPRTSVEATVLGIWSDLFRHRRIGVTTDFFASGGHSLSALKAVARMSDAFGVDFRLRDLYAHPTVAAFCAACIEAAPDRDALVLPLGPRVPRRPAVLLLPPAFGSAAIFGPLARRLSDVADVYGAEYPDLDEHDPDAGLSRIVDRLAEEASALADAPALTIVGYSVGAALAFELAKALESRRGPIRTVLIDCAVRPRGDGASDGFARWLDTFGPEERERLRRRIEPLRRAAAKYAPSGLVRGPVVALEASENPVRAGMEEWEAFTSGAFQHVAIAGDHYTLLYPEHLDAIAAIVSDEADTSTRSSAGGTASA